MVEEFYGKISRSGSNLSDSLEDKLTGDFFGTLRYMDFCDGLASTKGDLRCISVEHLLWEELPAANQTVRGVQLIFRGTGEDFNFYDIAKKAEAIADCFRGEVDLVWQVELWEENEILMFSAYEMHHAGVASKDV